MFIAGFIVSFSVFFVSNMVGRQYLLYLFHKAVFFIVDYDFGFVI